MRGSILALCLVLLPLALFAQGAPGAPGSPPILPSVPADGPLFSGTGDAAIARRYLEWAQKEAAAGRTAEAIAALERGADYAAVSSDLSCYLAMLQSKMGHSRFSIVHKCRLALETNRWEQYTPEDARLLEATALTGLRLYEEALDTLRYCDPEKYDTQYRRVLALCGIAQSYGEETGFINALTLIMDRFPRETGPVRILFDYASGSESIERLRPLADLALRRLPFLLEANPALAYMAAPFIYDRELARTYVASYRALGDPNPASLKAALNLGLVNGTQAVEELFAWRDHAADTLGTVLDRELVVEINGLLRLETERELLRRNLLRFSGVITEDRDHDGITEAWVTYRNGMVTEYRYDNNQDGNADLIISFEQGLPARANIALALSGDSPFLSGELYFTWISLRWERYPAVLDAELFDARHIPRPLDFLYTPVRFAPLVLGGPDYPQLDKTQWVLSSRSLLSFAVIVERPSPDFPGGIEKVEMSGGIPVKSSVTLNGKKVSETEFRLGVPFIQYLDIDMDGRMETKRRFDPDVPYRVLSTESDWDGDGVYEYAEILQDDGSVKKLWDFNRDGVRETER